MKWSKVILTLGDFVEHHDKRIEVLTFNVGGDPMPFARALQRGDFKVSVVTHEETETVVELP